MVAVGLYAVMQYLHLDPVRWPSDRIASLTGNPVAMSAALGLASPFSIYFYSQAGNRAGRFFWGIVSLILFALITGSLSRGPLIGFLVSSIIMIIALLKIGQAESKKSAVLICASLVVILALVFAFAAGENRHSLERFNILKLGTERSLGERFVYYEVALNMIKDYPVAGVGLENFGIAFPQYRPTGFSRIAKDIVPNTVHNGYLQIAVTSGLPALAIYFIFIGFIFRSILTSVRKSKDSDYQLLLVAFIASLAGYLVQDMTGWLEIALTPFFYVILGLAVSVCSSGEKLILSKWKRSMIYMAAALGIIIMIFLIADAVKKIRGEKMFWPSQSLDINADWPVIETNIRNGLAAIQGDFYYEDMAGVAYMLRLTNTGDAEAYSRGMASLRDAAQHNPFDSYVMIHIMEMDTVALTNNIIKHPSELSGKAIGDALRLDRNNPSVFEAAAKLKLAESNLLDALEFIQKAIVLKPDEVQYYAMEGYLYSNLSILPEGIKSYKNAILILERQNSYGPQWVNLKQALTLSLAENGDKKEALAEIESAIIRFPDIATSYVIQGDIFASMGAQNKASSSYETVFRLDPNGPYAGKALQHSERFRDRLNPKKSTKTQ